MYTNYNHCQIRTVTRTQRIEELSDSFWDHPLLKDPRFWKRFSSETLEDVDPRLVRRFLLDGENPVDAVLESTVSELPYFGTRALRRITINIEFD